jgi:hypothetical protein
MDVRYANDAYTRTRVLRKHGIEVVFTHDAGQPEHVEELMQQTMDVVEQQELTHLLVPVYDEARRVGFAI